MKDSLDADLLRFEPASLVQTVEQADLQKRVDRKYLVDLQVLGRVLSDLSWTHHVLEIAGRRATTYRTTYFDLPDYTSCRAHIQGRRRRWKVRSRLYVEDQFCRVEVKTKNGRGMTEKMAIASSADRYGTLVGADRDFVTESLEDIHPEVDVPLLMATAEITYSRACLVDLKAGTRVTVDGRLSSVLPQGRAWFGEQYVIVETKGGPTLSPADRLLLHYGARQRSFSKYAATTSLLHPTIADNDVRELHGTYLHSAATDALHRSEQREIA